MHFGWLKLEKNKSKGKKGGQKTKRMNTFSTSAVILRFGA
jgi:hypothetical protein